MELLHSEERAPETDEGTVAESLEMSAAAVILEPARSVQAAVLRHIQYQSVSSFCTFSPATTLKTFGV